MLELFFYDFSLSENKKPKFLFRVFIIGLMTISFSLSAQSLEQENTDDRAINQSVIAVAGNVDQSSGLILEWTLGESFIGTSYGEKSCYTVGFHQPLIQIRNNENEQVHTDTNVTVFPNPFSSSIHIKLEGTKGGPLKVGMTDLLGRIVLEKTFDGDLSDFEISCPGIPAGSYFLRLWNSEGHLINSSILIKSL